MAYEVWQPPVENQKGADSCVAQAFCNVLECIEYKRTGNHRNYSVGFMHGNPLNSAKRGMYLEDGVKILLEFGNVYRDVWECDFGGQLCKTLWLTQVTEDITNQAQKLIKGYVRLNLQRERQEYILKYGLPIIIVADAKHFGIDGATHAVACYGWDEDGMMLFTNSYGTAYGENGRGKIADEYIIEAIGLLPIDEGENIMRGIELLHPELQEIATEFVEQCKSAGLNVKITDTMRTKAEQDALYAQGRTATGSIVTNVAYPNSAHNWGVAFDICRNEKGREYDDSDGFFGKCGEIGKKLGLFWGGDFKSFTDKPHFEMPKFMPDNSTKWLKVNYGTPDKFIETWIKEDTKITAEQIAELLPRAFAILAKKPASSWSAKALEWAKRSGLMVGDESGNQMPQKPLTREEAAQMFYNMYGSEV